jgi:hypothetical protein
VDEDYLCEEAVRCGGVKSVEGRDELILAPLLSTTTSPPPSRPASRESPPASSRITMSRPKTLLSLPEDVLRESLAHQLLDTPRELHRAAILETCKVLHHLGTPVLYRIVDLVVCRSRESFFRHHSALFGAKGLLSKPRREGSFVRELRLGGVHDLHDTSWELQPDQEEPGESVALPRHGHESDVLPLGLKTGQISLSGT